MKIKHTVLDTQSRFSSIGHRKKKLRQTFGATIEKYPSIGEVELAFDVRTSGKLAKKIQNSTNFNH
jgi:hypothetical protein